MNFLMACLSAMNKGVMDHCTRNFMNNCHCGKDLFFPFIEIVAEEVRIKRCMAFEIHNQSYFKERSEGTEMGILNLYPDFISLT